MQLTQGTVDKIAMSTSIICAIHCLLFPTILILPSTFSSLQYNNELIHFWLLLVIVPFSIIGLITGLKNHKKNRVFFLGICGIVILSGAVLINEEIIGEHGESLFTLLGSIFVVTAHFKNYQLCRSLNCHCHDIFPGKRN